MKQHFKSQKKENRKTNIITSLMILLAGPLIIFLRKGEDNLIVLITIGLIGAVGSFVFYTWREKAKGAIGLEISDEHIRIEGKKEDICLKWADIESAQFYDYGGEQWFFKSKQRKKRIRLYLDGFSPEEIDIINQRIKDNQDVLK